MADIQNMSRLDELPPDQRAALSLLLRQRKSYAELAAVLAIPERAVHDRAHAALAVLAPRQARELDPKRREEIGDYLLGQQPGVAERLATRTYLSASAPAQAWAGALVGELGTLAGAALPEIPPPSLGALPGASGSAARPTTVRAATARATTPRASTARASSGSSAGSLPSSRLGGALILATIVAAIVVAAILLSSGGGSHAKTTASSPPATSSTGNSSTSSKAASTTGNPAVRQRLTLHSANAKSRSAAAVDIIAEGSKRAFYIEAQHLAASKGFFYAIWLYSSPRSFLPLSKSPPVGSNKRLAGGALLPANAASYREMLLTRETSDHPTHPGRVVLRGPFSLGA
jgi:hypothetical protein